MYVCTRHVYMARHVHMCTHMYMARHLIVTCVINGRKFLDGEVSGGAPGGEGAAVGIPEVD
jgi:hypothetical protein